ncbi:MAG: transcriptional regulator [Peptoniphilaceae bacterium]|nr:transcriptional regulator [Peptoniphilaceae bacterium]MDY6018354.1 P-II family nitrogen regulator [Anaerococcus sp.]
MKLLTIILAKNKGTKIMKVLDSLGAGFTSCLLGESRCDDQILNMLVMGKEKKEIVRTILEDDKANEILDSLEEKIKEDNTAIAFTIDIEDVEDKGANDMEYEAIHVIVDREEGDKVIKIAQENGAKGATVMHGRGAGINKKALFMNMTIEPEKDIVLMLVKKELSEKIKDAIYEQMNLDKESKGIIFSLVVSDVRGLVDQN